MNVFQDFFDQLCPSYKNAIKNLDQNLDECNGDVEKRREIMLEFSSKFLMPIPYWCDIIREAKPTRDEKLLNMLATKAQQHLYAFLLPPKDNDTPLNKLLMFLFSEDYEGLGVRYDEKDLCYPHPHLSGCLYKLETASNRPLPKELLKIYESNKELYQKIKAAESNVVEWFRLICKFGDESGDDQYVKLMVEYRLGLNLFDIQLWKLYIDKLREQNPHEMLHLYSKYCRFFVDDLEMKELYKLEEEKYGPVFVPWSNRFEFETPLPIEDEPIEEENDENFDGYEVRFGNAIYRYTMNDMVPNPGGIGMMFKMKFHRSVNEAPPTTDDGADQEDGLQMDAEVDDNDQPFAIPEDENLLSPEPEEVDGHPFQDFIENDSPPPEFFNFSKNQISPIFPEILLLSKNFYNSYENQEFPFKAPFLKYILDAANPSTLKKLHQTCKFFFSKKPTPICYKIEASCKTMFCEDAMEISICENFDNETFKSTDLCKNYILTNSFIDEYIMRKNVVHQIISNIYSCEAKYIQIRCSLSPAEIKILLQSGNVIVCKLNNSYRGEDDDIYVPKMEEMTQYLPKVEELYISPVVITPETIKTILNQKFVSKLFSLGLTGIQGEPFDIDGFLKFCVNNRAAIFKLTIGFHSSFGNELFCETFKDAMKNYERTTMMTDLKILPSFLF